MGSRRDVNVWAAAVSFVGSRRHRAVPLLTEAWPAGGNGGISPAPASPHETHEHAHVRDGAQAPGCRSIGRPHGPWSDQTLPGTHAPPVIGGQRRRSQSEPRGLERAKASAARASLSSHPCGVRDELLTPWIRRNAVVVEAVADLDKGHGRADHGGQGGPVCPWQPSSSDGVKLPGSVHRLTVAPCRGHRRNLRSDPTSGPVVFSGTSTMSWRCKYCSDSPAAAA